MSETTTQAIISAAQPIRLNQRVLVGYVGQFEMDKLARYAKAINACRFACEVAYYADNAVAVYAARRTAGKP